MLVIFVLVALGTLLAAILAEPPQVGRGTALIFLAAAFVVSIVLIAIGSALRWQWGSLIIVPVAFVFLIAISRHEFGGVEAGVAPLYLLPVVWAALYSTRAGLAITLLSVLLALSLPIIIYGEPDYPVEDWRRVITNMAVAVSVAILISLRSNQAVHDPLTGLGNRRAWEQSIEQQPTRSRRRDDVFSVIAMDFDQFKVFNDTKGHTAADALLVGSARAWKQALRPSDVLVRIGGDEFLLLLPATGREEGANVIRRLATLTPEGQTFSAGLAQWRGEDAENIVRLADAALYISKRSGRNRLTVLSEEGAYALPTTEELGWDIASQ